MTQPNSFRSNTCRFLLALMAPILVSCEGDSHRPQPSLSGAVECRLPAPLQWTASEPLIVSPVDQNHGTLYAPTIVNYENTFHVFATVEHPWTTEYRSVYLSFNHWLEASVADPMPLTNTAVSNAISPQVFYFRPQNQWYMISDSHSSYSTNADINNPNGWTPMQTLLGNEASQPIWLDQWVICNDSHCFLFFVDVINANSIVMSKTPIANFPQFPAHNVVMDTRKDDGTLKTLYVAPSVYKIAGQEKYLMLAGKRFSPAVRTASIAAWQAPSLDGPWEPIAQDDNTFASATNVHWPENTQWADGIYDGELLRQSADERQIIDLCNLEFLFNGDTAPYLPVGIYTQAHKVGLLTLMPGSASQQ